jgi:hypothetical protein
MRTLLNECLPPTTAGASAASPSQEFGQPQRIFSENAVLDVDTADSQEVGLGGTMIATPGASANQAASVPGRGAAPAAVNSPGSWPRTPSEQTSAAV